MEHITHLFAFINCSWYFFLFFSFFLSALSACLPPHRLQLRRDVPSISAAQPEGSPEASTPTDTAVEEGEGGGPEGKIDGDAEEEAPKGASLAQEKSAKQDGVCG